MYNGVEAVGAGPGIIETCLREFGESWLTRGDDKIKKNINKIDSTIGHLFHNSFFFFF